MNLEVCPGCGQLAFDSDTGECRSCHAKGINRRSVSMAHVLDGFVHNVRLRLTDLEDDEFQQVIGLFSGTADDPEGGIAFSQEDAMLAYRHLQSAGVACLQVKATVDGRDSYSLIFARNQPTIENAKSIVRSMAVQERVGITFINSTHS